MTPETRTPPPPSNKEPRLLTIAIAQTLVDASIESEERLNIALAATKDATRAAARSLESLNDELKDDLRDAEDPQNGGIDLVQRFFRYFVEVEDLTRTMFKSMEKSERILRIFPEWWFTVNNTAFCQEHEAHEEQPVLDKVTGKCPKCTSLNNQHLSPAQ